MKKEFKSAFVAFVGRPNVGKSTLMNQLLGQKIAIMSDKPQTTRNKINGIFTDEDAQLIFVDTPGVHKAANQLGDYMNKVVRSSISDVDIICFMVNGTEFFGTGDQFVLDLVKEKNKPIFLIINKIDLLSDIEIANKITELNEKANFAEIIPISAKTSKNTDRLLEALKKHAKVGPMYYDSDTVTDNPERFIMAELIREKILHHTREEVPHSVAVITEEVKRQEDGSLYVRAVIIVDRQSQKGIIIGKGGTMLKKIGTGARKEMQRIFDERIHLETFVKVEPKWRDKQMQLKNFGYSDKEM